MAATEDIPEHLTCPICCNLPENEVYQCEDGHVVCKTCFSQLTECPQCRRPFEGKRIRNRYFEGLLDEYKIACSYKSNGCTKVLPRNSVKEHELCCHFDFKKFGPTIFVCKLLGYTKCNFLFNNGNCQDAINHFISQHSCILSNSDNFEMKLAGLNDRHTNNEGIHIWTPIIVKLKNQQCSLLTMARLNNEDKSLAWVALFLPDSQKNGIIPKPSLNMEYSIMRYASPPSKFTFIQEPFTLDSMKTYLPGNVPCRFQTSSLISYFTGNESLAVNCKVLSKGSMEEKQNQQEIFICTKSHVEKPTILPKPSKDFGSVEKKLGSLSISPHHDALIDKLITSEKITKSRVEAAMRSVDKGDFTEKDPYSDGPQGIGFGVTISAPHMHAFTLEILEDYLKPGARVLDVGAGSGYLTTCMAMMVGDNGQVVGIDCIDGVVEMSKENVMKNHGYLLYSGKIRFICGDGRKGFELAGPYDIIHIGAATEVVPQKLVDQLKPCGVIIAPIGPKDGNQNLQRILKFANGRTVAEDLLGVRYGHLV